MEFLLYLSPESSEIYKMVSRKVRVVENTPICRQHDIFGYYDAVKKNLSICISRIKTYGNLEENVTETFLHESVHIAQDCKTKGNYLAPFGISPSVMDLNQRRQNDLKRTIAFDSRLKYIDMEAYWMEDKPDKVKYVVQKYCF
jgi:hypothetical protein